MHKLYVLFVIGLLWTGADGRLLKDGQQVTKISTLQEQEIIETVFHYQMQHCYQNVSRKVYFLTDRKVDPRDPLMERFRPYGNLVRKRSELGEFLHEKSDELPVLLSIRRIEPESDVTINVFGSCGTGPFEGASYLYRVVRRSGSWRITKQKLRGVQ